MRSDRPVRYERVDFDSDPDDNDQLRARRKLAKDLGANREMRCYYNRRKGNCERLIRSVFVLAVLLATAAAGVTLFVYRTDIYEMVSDADAIADKIVAVYDHNKSSNQTLLNTNTTNKEDLNSDVGKKATSQSTASTNDLKNEDDNKNDDDDDMSFVDDVDDSSVEYPDFDDDLDDGNKAKSRSKRSLKNTLNDDFNKDNEFDSTSSSSSSSSTNSEMDMTQDQYRKRSTLGDNSGPVESKSTINTVSTEEVKSTASNNEDNSSTSKKEANSTISQNDANSTASQNDDNSTISHNGDKSTTTKNNEEDNNTLYNFDTDELWTRLDELDLLALCVLGAVSALSVLLMLFCFSRMMQARRRSRRQQFRRLVNDLNASEKYTIITPSDDELSD